MTTFFTVHHCGKKADVPLVNMREHFIVLGSESFRTQWKRYLWAKPIMHYIINDINAPSTPMMIQVHGFHSELAEKIYPLLDTHINNYPRQLAFLHISAQDAEYIPFIFSICRGYHIVIVIYAEHHTVSPIIKANVLSFTSEISDGDGVIFFHKNPFNNNKPRSFHVNECCFYRDLQKGE